MNKELPKARPAGPFPKNMCYCVVCAKQMREPAYATPQGLTYCEDHRPDKERNEEPEEDEVRIRLSRRSTLSRRN